MSASEIIAELPKLSLAERRRLAGAIFELEAEAQLLQDCDRRADEHFANAGRDGSGRCQGQVRVNVMERIIRVHLEKLPEGVYLATSDDVQGLVAQGRTLAETMEIARDIAKKLLEEQAEEAILKGAL
jgi:predicted RNase H-like HicB family nuclease